jgi:drug/metabolite transporter (DMT)-like permease
MSIADDDEFRSLNKNGSSPCAKIKFIRQYTLELVSDEESAVPAPPPHAALLTTPPSAYLLLATAVLSLSAAGPLLQAQNHVNSTMKVCWRQFATSVLLFPFAVVSFRKDGPPKMTMAQWSTFLLTSVCYTTSCLAFCLSLEYTAVGNAVIFSNSQSLILLAGKMLVGHRVSPLEGTGALVAFSGAIFCSVDSSQGATPEDSAEAGERTFFGDCVAFLSALGSVGYLCSAKQTRNNMNLYMFMYLLMLTGSILTLIFMTVILKEPVTWDRHVSTGVFGWLSMDEQDRLPLEILIVGICNFCGAVGYVRAMQFFDTLVICVATLMEPVAADFLACLMGVGILPGWKGWLGNAMVVGGTSALVYRPQQPGGDKLASLSK